VGGSGRGKKLRKGEGGSCATEGDVTLHSPRSRYNRHFVDMTRHSALSGEGLSCYSNKIEAVEENFHKVTDLPTKLV